MAADSTISRRPDLRFLVSHPAHFVALGFGAGLAPVAPGTFGTLLSVGLYWALAPFVPALAIAFGAIPLFFVWKPYPIREIERRAKGGFGVMIDDVFAAFYAYVAFAAIVVVAVRGFGYRG
jgi:phosphatidylglycerophosphatase A